MQRPLALVRAVLGSKVACRLDSQGLSRLGVAILEAFLSSLPAGAESDDEFGQLQSLAPSIRYLSVTGYDSAESECVAGGVILDMSLPDNLPDSLVPKLRNALTVLYDISLEPPDANFVMESTVHSVWNASEVDRARLLKLAEKFASEGVRIVCSQKLIAPFLKEALMQQGILPLERLSIRHIQAVQLVTGCQVLSDLRIQSVRPAVLGRIGSVQQRVLSARKYIVLTKSDESSRAISTILLKGPDTVAVEELEFTVRSAVSILTAALRVPFGLVGCGQTEAHLAAMLDSKVLVLEDMSRPLPSILPGHLSLAHRKAVAAGVRSFSSCLKRISALVNKPLDRDEETGVSQSLQTHILDSLPVKMHAIQIAVETANALLKVQG
mmetsp:Transcript_19947/g.32725  ORF Transcript_19947/g.32725 Transcript_19947/m.32725 type:complete len:382 (-) Transcript_19947:116-1261(-)